MIVNTITQCNRIFSAKTPNPLVSVIRLSDLKEAPDLLQFGFYTIWLKQWKVDTPSCFGKKNCDFCDNTLVPLRPGTSIHRELLECNISKSEGILLCFHTSIFNPCRIEECAHDYSFFKYRIDESLHLSFREQQIIEREIFSIEEELYWGIDEHSYTILAERIKLLLDYITRFYKRQFILRHDDNMEMVNETEALLSEFFYSGKAQNLPLPTLENLAEQFDVSPVYLNDLLKYETGKDFENYINYKRISIAENLLKNKDRNVQEVAAILGFPTDNEFCILFKRLGGNSPGSVTSNYELKRLN